MIISKLLFLALLLPLSSSSSNPNPNPNPHVDGFSVELIHRDSPLSPFYNPDLTDFDRIVSAAHRSNARSHLSPNSIESPTYPNDAAHLMKFSIGTPPKQILAVMDTGSNLFWSRCKPCVDCADRPVPFFDPANSSTYTELTCDSPTCKVVDSSACSKGPKCNYLSVYGDGSFTSGVVGTETFTFDSDDGSPVSFPNISFGCGHNNSPSFDVQFAGLAGIGPGSLSLISQLGSSIEGKFSYCLVPFEEKSSTSKMKFGKKSDISGNNVVSTPLLPKTGWWYFVTLERISVGGTSIDVVNPNSPDSGDIIIDCGTTVTLLGNDVFERLSDVVAEAVKLPRLKDAGGTFTCFNSTDRAMFPDITFHFAGGADLVMHPLNVYTVPSPDGLVCLSMQATDGIKILGNAAQQNFVVAYDLVRKKVSFSATKCSSWS